MLLSIYIYKGPGPGSYQPIMSMGKQVLSNKSGTVSLPLYVYSLSLHTSVYLSITFDAIDVMIDWSSIIDAILTIILLICIYTSITAPVGAVQLVFPKADRGSLVPEGTSDIGPGTCFIHRLYLYLSISIYISVSWSFYLPIYNSNYWSFYLSIYLFIMHHYIYLLIVYPIQIIVSKIHF